MRKIVITGGHPSPALAVIDQIKNTRPGWEVHFIGVKHPLTGDKAVSYEYKEITSRGVAFYEIKTGKFSRLLTLRGLLELLLVPVGLIQSTAWLTKIKPRMILTFGGYIGIPVALAGFILGIPIVIHEQTLQIGLANRLIAILATKVFLSWPQTQIQKNSAIAEKFCVTGLPVRKNVNSVKKPKFVRELTRSKKPLLYITGGSQGAHFINQLIMENLNKLLKHFNIIHQAGESTKYNDLPKLQSLQTKGYVVFPHISSEHIGWVLNKADIIVSRAGMNSIAELLYLKKHAIIIPLPKRINPEQAENARLYKQSGLGHVLEQERATPDIFVETLHGLWSDIEKKQLHMSKIKGQELQSPQAAKRIVAEIEKIM